jgi:hypothetical protein
MNKNINKMIKIKKLKTKMKRKKKTIHFKLGLNDEIINN